MQWYKRNFHPYLKAIGASFLNPGIRLVGHMKHLLKALLPAPIGIFLLLSLGMFLHAQAAVVASAPTQTPVIDAGLAYLKSQQQPNGGILGFSGMADPDTTARSLLAYVVAGTPVSEVLSPDGNSMVDYLASQAITFTHDTIGTLFPGRAGELLTAVSLAGGAASNFGGMDLINELQATYHNDTGAYSTSAQQDYSSGAASDLNQAWAILGLSLAGQAMPDGAAKFLIKSQAEDGSWGAGDPDTTALAVTALLASTQVDAQNEAIQRAIEFFHATQAPSAGWKPSWDTDPLNADSTGWIIQALVSAGENVSGQSWKKNDTNPMDALSGMQKPDGAIGGTYANTYSTAEAIIGLSGVPLSSRAHAPATHRAGLVVFSGDRSLFTDCISFTASSLTGLELLQRSGQAIQTATNPTQGTAVCKIGEVGDASNNCFGSMPNYWSYWDMGKNGWEYSAVGADQSQVVNGGVYAWSWGTGNPPPVITFRNVCEGVAFTLPTTTATSLPLATSTQPGLAATPVPTMPPPQPTAVPTTVTTGTGSYVLFVAILLAVALLVISLIRARKG
jgi:hypothetical protein